MPVVKGKHYPYTKKGKAAAKAAKKQGKKRQFICPVYITGWQILSLPMVGTLRNVRCARRQISSVPFLVNLSASLHQVSERVWELKRTHDEQGGQLRCSLTPSGRLSVPMQFEYSVSYFCCNFTCSVSNDCSLLAGIMINAPIFTIFALFPDTSSFEDALYGSIRGLGGVDVRPFPFLWLYESKVVD